MFAFQDFEVTGVIIWGEMWLEGFGCSRFLFRASLGVALTGHSLTKIWAPDTNAHPKAVTQDSSLCHSLIIFLSKASISLHVFYFYINKYACTNCSHLIPEDSGLLLTVVAIMLVENRASVLSLNLGSISSPVCLLLSWGVLPSVWLMFRACALPDLFLCCLCKFHLTTYFFKK